MIFEPTQYHIMFVLSKLSITIYKKNTNFWDDFFMIPILSLKKTTKKKIKHNFHIKVGFQYFV
jgi:hypothetical protein